MNYNDDKDSGGELIGVALATTVLGGLYLLDRNKRVECCFCQRVEKNKDLVVVELGKRSRWSSSEPREVARHKISEKKMCVECANKVLYLDCCECSGSFFYSNLVNANFNILSWPEDFVLTDEIVQMRNKYTDKLMCSVCFEKTKNHINDMIESLKVICPICKELKTLPYKWIRPNEDVLPLFWPIEQYDNVEICKECRDKIVKSEVQRRNSAKEGVEDYSARYRGKVKFDPSSVKLDVESGKYRDMYDAVDELKLRAYLEGYDIVYSWKQIAHTETEDADPGSVDSPNYIRGVHRYTMYSVIGNFGKRKP